VYQGCASEFTVQDSLHELAKGALNLLE